MFQSNRILADQEARIAARVALGSVVILAVALAPILTRGILKSAVEGGRND